MTLASFYSTQIISNDLLPNFTLASIPIDLQRFTNDVAKTITIKSIKLSSVDDNSIQFICGRSKTKNSKIKNLLEWIKDDEIVNLIKNFELKLGTYEIFFKKSNDDDVPKKYTTGNEEDLKELAELGVFNAQIILGLLYAKCIESKIEQSDIKAIELFQKVSEQGSFEGDLCLGFIYSKEHSSIYDPQKAFDHYKKASEKGNGIAMRNLAIMHLVGEGVPQNLRESVKLFKKANNQFGDSVSGNILGILYQKGIGVPKSLHESVKYFRKASDSNDINAKINLGLLLFNGEGVEKNEAEAVKLFQVAAEHGFVRAQILLAKAYERGLGVEKNYEKAIEWFSKVAEREGTDSSIDYVGESQYCLACLYEKGFGDKEKDPEKALYWFTKSSENNYLTAQVTLGDMYRDGHGVEVDEGKALKWYITAAKYNNFQAQFVLGELYEVSSLGVKKDETKALQWYKKSAEQGYIMALMRLGLGTGSDPDVSRKLQMITKLPSVKTLEQSGQAPQPTMIDDDEILEKIGNLKDGEKLEVDDVNGSCENQ
ncbi:10856_t:CDS:2 [Funneliformis caledonium]|uniref:10856_t:CDS:1 n=1 Tax=Funneliformis caledonium TaxID=1117310 RepID=A0A9N9CIC9_9GLOM|nr:10856_t:CDS:2 [Funneliformis caledonium]